MALISDKGQFIYIRVPKTGSSSVLRSLDCAGMAPICNGGGHETAAQAKAHIKVDVWKAYEKFAFVRHPLKWLASYKMFRHRFEGRFEFDKFLAQTMTPYDWMTDKDGNVLVDRIYRTEDMASAMANYGALPCHYNATPGRDALDLTSAQMDAVRQKCAREFQHYED